MHILAIDIGTSSVKAGVVDVDAGPDGSGAVVGSVASIRLTLDRPVPGAAEIPAARVWSAVVDAGRAAVASAAAFVDARAIDGVGLSCLTPGLVLLDERDAVLGPVWLHLDRRSTTVAQRLDDDVGPAFLHTVGARPLPGGISCTSFVQRVASEPGLRDRVRGYLHLNGWLGLQLGGARSMDVANASYTGLWGTLTDQLWNDALCRRCGVDTGWLPPVVDGAAAVGGLMPAAAAALGLRAGTPVKPGTSDASSAALCAQLQPGELLHVVGTTQVLCTMLPPGGIPVPHASRLLRRFGVGDGLVSITHNPVGGAALEWIRQLCFRDVDVDAFYGAVIDDALLRAAAPSHGVRLDPPWLGGDRLTLDAPRAAFTGLGLDTDRLDLLAAVLRELRDRHRDAVVALGAVPITGPATRFTRVCISGGAGKTVRRLLGAGADSDVVVPLEQASLRGVAALFR